MRLFGEGIEFAAFCGGWNELPEWVDRWRVSGSIIDFLQLLENGDGVAACDHFV